MKAKFAVSVALILMLGTATSGPVLAAPHTSSGTSDATVCAVAPNPDGTFSVTCGPGQTWPVDPPIGTCFDKQLQPDGFTWTITCEPAGIDPPTTTPPSPVPTPTTDPCVVATNADGTISVTCGPGQSWPNDLSIGACFDKRLQPDGSVVVLCQPAGNPVTPTPTPPHKVVVPAKPATPTVAQKLAAKKLAAKKAAAKRLAAKKLAAKKLAAKKAAAKRLAAKRLAAAKR